MSDRKISNSSASETQLSWKHGAVFSALIAMFAVQIFRMDHHRWLPAMLIEATVTTLIPILFFLLLRRWQQMKAENFGQQKVMFVIQGLICVSVLLMMAWQYISRAIGLGDANEILALLVLQVVSFHLAVFASVRGFERASFVLCGALVFFVCCATTRAEVLVVSGFFAVSALWWMAGLYWSRLDSKAIDGKPKMFAVHASATLISVVVIGICIGLSLLIPLAKGQFSSAGFSPFSGGKDGQQDEFASSGIGDGNMLTAGENATTTGAVDSDNFIEDDKPSIYDVMSEQYDGPIFRKRRNRAVSLNKKAKHIHDVKESEQSGRTFRTMRKTGGESDIDFEDRLTKALFFVEGSVPARFISDTFQHFDGWDWTKTSIDGFSPMKSRISLRKSSDGKPIFSLAQFKPDYLPVTRAHKIKMMRLETPVLPAPCFLDRWHIAFVDKEDLFDWSDSHLIEFSGAVIPPKTVIDVQSFVPNYHLMRSKPSFHQRHTVGQFEHFIDQWIGAAGIGGDPSVSAVQPQARPKIKEPDSPYLQLPETGNRQRLDDLAKEFTAGLPAGWKQVEAIMHRMREDYKLNHQWKTDESTEDTVGHFLDQGGGPSWMFATTCAMVLRSAGYRTRLTSGFLVRNEDYSRLARQSTVTSENLHMWPEVCMDGKFWIPLEPTPGYPIPYCNETFTQWLTAKAAAIVGWFWARPILSLLMLVTCCVVYRSRIQILTSLMLLWWHLVRWVWPRNLLNATRQVIDLRFRLAGDQRPNSRTLKNWYSRVEPQGNSIFFDLWNRKNYCSTAQNLTHAELVTGCSEPIESLNLRKIQQFVSNRKERETL